MSSPGFSNPVSLKDAFQKLECVSNRYPPESNSIEVDFLKPGMILAEDIETDVDIPEVRTSTVNGFAVIVSDPSNQRRIVGLSTASTPYYATLVSGECVRIGIGGMVPGGADCVVLFDDIAYIEDGASIVVTGQLKECHNFKEKGQQAKIGDILLRAGSELDSISIALLRNLGVTEVEIYHKPRVCIISVGDENCDPRGKSNLMKLFHSQGFKAIDAGAASNNSSDVQEKIKVAAEFACVIVITGDLERVQQAVEQWKLQTVIQSIDCVPNKFSFACGKINDYPVLLCILSDDPWIGANLFVSPILRKMEGRINKTGFLSKSKLTRPVSKSSKIQFIRARTESSEGTLISTPLCGLGGNSIIEIPENLNVSIGDTVNVLFVDSISF